MKLQDRLTSNAHWLLRIGIVSVFLFHGVLKFSNLEGFASMLPISYAEVVWVALANVGSVLLLAGGFGSGRISDVATRIGAAFNIPVMIGAIYLVHWGRWNFVPIDTHPLGGMEFQVILVLVMLYLIITGNSTIRSADPKPAAA